MKNNCRKLRDASDFTREQLAVYGNIGIASIYKLEHGESLSMKLLTVTRIAMARGCSVVDLIPALGVRPRKPRIRQIKPWEPKKLGVAEYVEERLED